MLVIRDAQMTAFRTQLESRFRDRLRSHLKRTVSPGKFTDEDLDKHILAGIEQARDCGLTRERDAAQLVETVCLHLDGFPHGGLPKQIRHVLYAHGVDPAVKLRRFVEWCQGQAAKAATSCQTISDPKK